MLSVVAALYLLLRKSNAIVPGVTPPLRLRRWAAAFMLFAAVSHVTWIFYIYHPSTPGYILAYTLDVRKLTTKNWAKHSKVSPDTAFVISRILRSKVFWNLNLDVLEMLVTEFAVIRTSC